VRLFCNFRIFLQAINKFILISYITILVLPSVTARLKHVASVTYQSIKTVNLFKTGKTNEVDLRQQQIYTRVYLVFYISSLSVLLFYTAVVERSISKTYLSPSIMDYEQLTDIWRQLSLYAYIDSL
jgi:hypothetical protein